MGESENGSSRHLNHQDDLVIPENEAILVIDNGCDQSILNMNSFLIHSFAGIHSDIGEALHSIPSETFNL